ncbi:MAG TPA: hypothetical protein ENI60_06975 [Candidatus Fraserbacteria bacterium]|nr:hypothetical protein [Candidatus Fraserbacteria bacterium]
MSYEYLNTRLHALRAKLLPPDAWERLLGLSELSELVNYLAETDYAPEIEASSVEYSGYALVEDALLRHGGRILGRIYRMDMGEPHLLIGLVLERFDLFNLKTILRGFHAEASQEEIAQTLYPTVLMPLSFYQELLKHEDIAGCIDYLLAVGHRDHKPLAAALPEYDSSGKLALLESALDSFYFGSSRAKLLSMGGHNAAQVRRALGSEADLLNIVYALRVVEEGVSSEERYRYILAGGENLTREFVRKLIDSGDPAVFARLLGETPYAPLLEGFEEALAANTLQERLESSLYERNCHFNVGQPFSIGLALALIWRQQVEMTNLRVITQGLAYHAARADIERNMIRLETVNNRG